jgi:hypothetical protein
MRTILALTAVTALAVTTVTVFSARGALIGSPEPTASTHQTPSGGVGANPQGNGFLRSYDRLAKGDMSGTGGGSGGHKGAMKGGMKGGMHGSK